MLPQMLLYMALAPESKLTYKVWSPPSPCSTHTRANPQRPTPNLPHQEGGPAAEARFEAGVAGFEARSFRGCGVMTSEPFEVSDGALALARPHRHAHRHAHRLRPSPDPIAPSPRRRLGPDAHALVADRRVLRHGAAAGLPRRGRKGKFTCDILIYDEESDRHVRVTWRDALKACLLAVGANAHAEGIAGDVPMDGKGDVAAWVAKADLWATYSESGGSKGAYEAAAGGGGLDVRIVLARPFIEHLMHNAILTVAGRDTGATLFGPADMQLSVILDPIALLPSPR